MLDYKQYETWQPWENERELYELSMVQKEQHFDNQYFLNTRVLR